MLWKFTWADLLCCCIFRIVLCLYCSSNWEAIQSNVRWNIRVRSISWHGMDLSGRTSEMFQIDNVLFPNWITKCVEQFLFSTQLCHILDSGCIQESLTLKLLKNCFHSIFVTSKINFGPSVHSMGPKVITLVGVSVCRSICPSWNISLVFSKNLLEFGGEKWKWKKWHGWN